MLRKALTTVGDYASLLANGEIDGATPPISFNFPFNIKSWDLKIPEVNIDLGHINLSDTFKGKLTATTTVPDDPGVVAERDDFRIDPSTGLLVFQVPAMADKYKVLIKQKEQEIAGYEATVDQLQKEVDELNGQIPVMRWVERAYTVVRRRREGPRTIEEEDTVMTTVSVVDEAANAAKKAERDQCQKALDDATGKLQAARERANSEEVKAVLEDVKKALSGRLLYLEGDVDVYGTPFKMPRLILKADQRLDELVTVIQDHLGSSADQYLTAGFLAQLFAHDQFAGKSELAFTVPNITWTIDKYAVSSTLINLVDMVLHEVNITANFSGAIKRSGDTVEATGSFTVMGQSFDMTTIVFKETDYLDHVREQIAKQIQSDFSTDFFEDDHRYWKLITDGWAKPASISTSQFKVDLDFQAPLSKVSANYGSVSVKETFIGNLYINALDSDKQHLDCTLSGSAGGDSPFSLHFSIEFDYNTTLAQLIEDQVKSNAASGSAFAFLYGSAEAFLNAIHNGLLVGLDDSKKKAALEKSFNYSSDDASTITNDLKNGKITLHPKHPGNGNGNGDPVKKIVHHSSPPHPSHHP